MSAAIVPRYGTPNVAMLRRWIALGADEDGPFWAVNLMRYRPRAEYADGRATALSGREADDLYTPLGPLAAIGAGVVFAADVSEQLAGEPRFDRIGIVRYPSRARFLEMQTREDFQALHAHKDAGMEFTIVFSSQLAPGAMSTSEQGLILRLLRHGRVGGEPRGDDGGVVLARFEVEGVIVGDERSWDEARLESVSGPGSLDALLGSGAAEDQIVMRLASPMLDQLAGS